jgi:hypothetical protein
MAQHPLMFSSRSSDRNRSAQLRLAGTEWDTAVDDRAAGATVRELAVLAGWARGCAWGRAFLHVVARQPGVRTESRAFNVGRTAAAAGRAVRTGDADLRTAAIAEAHVAIRAKADHGPAAVVGPCAAAGGADRRWILRDAWFRGIRNAGATLTHTAWTRTPCQFRLALALLAALTGSALFLALGVGRLQSEESEWPPEGEPTQEPRDGTPGLAASKGLAEAIEVDIIQGGPPGIRVRSSRRNERVQTAPPDFSRVSLPPTQSIPTASGTDRSWVQRTLSTSGGIPQLPEEPCSWKVGKKSLVGEHRAQSSPSAAAMAAASRRLATANLARMLAT